MPFYEYECQSCKFYAEVMQKISEAPLTKCPSCGKKALKKLLSAPVFRLKGSGWYETDFKSDKENKRNLVGADKEESAAPDAAKKTDSDSQKGDAGKSDAKAEAKPEAKAQGKAAAEPRETGSRSARSGSSGRASPGAGARPAGADARGRASSGTGSSSGSTGRSSGSAAQSRASKSASRSVKRPAPRGRSRGGAPKKGRR